MLVTEKVINLAEYLNFVDIFSKKSAAKLSEHFNINKHSINLESDKELSYGLINSLEPVELKILKTYIKTILANGFIRPLKSSVKAHILFVQKLDGNFYLYMNYWCLNNLTIRNPYPLPLIDISLNHFREAN